MKRTLRRGLFTVATAVMVLLSACTAVPTDGPVRVGLTDLRQADQAVQYNPVGPSRGASKEDVVRGFVQATTSSVDDYAVAREFLTAPYSQQWDPYLGVLVDDGSRVYTEGQDDSGVLSVAAVAKVDSDGLMQPVERDPTTDMRFEFEEVDGEWRINSAPNGIILDRTVFTTIWSSHDIMFLGAGGYLVPETRWFLSRTALVTEVVGALLEGPSELMATSLRSGVPTGTTLRSGAVPIVDGRAQIDLSSEMLLATPYALSEANEQFSSSLQGIAGVSGFDLFVDGTPLETISEIVPIEPPSAADVANPSVLMNSVFGTLVSGELRPFQALSAQVVAAKPDAITLSRDETVAAVRTSEGVLRIDQNATTMIDERDGQLEPSIDMLGYIWTIDPRDDTQILVTAPDGTQTPVSAPWLAGRSPVAVRLSLDGSRIAALLPHGSGSSVVVAGVVRDELGTPRATSDSADPQLWLAGAPIDFDWIDQTRFAALTSTGNGGKVTTGGPGVFQTEKGTVPGGAHVSGGGIASQLRVLGTDGSLYASQGSGWQRSEFDIAVLAKRD